MLYFVFFFFLTIRRPPRSTLFPTRRSSDLVYKQPAASGARASRRRLSRSHAQARSEEHTSELQSLRHLVCRLLLEKKKPKTDTNIQRHPNKIAEATQTYTTTPKRQTTEPPV